MKEISRDEGDGSRDQAWASEHAKEGVTRRIVLKDQNFSLLDDAEPGLSHRVGKGAPVDFATNPRPSALATLKAQKMIRPVTGSNNRASPSSICIPLIRLERPALASAPAA
jgi:hypothetical protein